MILKYLKGEINKLYVVVISEDPIDIHPYIQVKSIIVFKIDKNIYKKTVIYKRRLVSLKQRIIA